MSTPTNPTSCLDLLSEDWRSLADFCETELARTKTDPPTGTLSEAQMIRLEQAANIYRLCACSLDAVKKRTRTSLCQADEQHRHLYHPHWSAKEMEMISGLAHRHHMSPVELIRDAVANWDQGWKIRHSARYILEDVPPHRLAEVCGLPLGVIVSALENFFPEEHTNHLKV